MDAADAINTNFLLPVFIYFNSKNPNRGKTPIRYAGVKKTTSCVIIRIGDRT
jgi:hypothetical protein